MLLNSKSFSDARVREHGRTVSVGKLKQVVVWQDEALKRLSCVPGKLLEDLEVTQIQSIITHQASLSSTMELIRTGRVT